MPIPDWVTIDDPVQILGEARPRSFEDLLTASQAYKDLYYSWVGQRGADYQNSFYYLYADPDQMTVNNRDTWRGYHEQTYGQFVAAIGQLKDELRVLQKAQKRALKGEAPATWAEFWQQTNIWWPTWVKWANDSHRGESAAFLTTLHTYKASPNLGDAEDLFNTYIDVGSQQQINLDDGPREDTRKALAEAQESGQPPANLFDAAENQVLFLLEQEYGLFRTYVQNS